MEQDREESEHGFLGRPYDTSLLRSYEHHVASRLWLREIIDLIIKVI